ncbi:MAG: LysR family transcriptional regulator [Caulobacteraceae bacterium]|nr:LysR family transcriptional regulator [Caulobacter sp.]
MAPVLKLDQLRVFATVEETGSFSAAARVLGRAQSAVTYAIQELEADLRTPLFDRSGYRPVLSPAGRALLPRARRVLREAQALQVQADGLAGGLEASISLVVDAAFPMATLTAALIAFQEAFPSVATHMHVESLGAGADMVMAGEADLGLVVAPFAPPDRLELAPAGALELAPVCAPAHPLALRQRADPQPIPLEAAQDHLQLVLSDRSPRTRDQEHGVVATTTWRLADLGAKHAMLRAGLGWGSLPRHLAEDDLRSGRLVELRLARWPVTERLPRLDLLVARLPDRAPGPAARWLFARLTRSRDKS